MTDSKGPWLQVVAGILIDSNGDCLMAQRPAGKVYAGYWEFPGGKVEPGETLTNALARELAEEIGIAVDPLEMTFWRQIQYVYPHAQVDLHFFFCPSWQGQTVPQEGQTLRWQHDFECTPVLPATAPLLAELRVDVTQFLRHGHAQRVK